MVADNGKTRALLIIDLQYDFLPGGALAVAEGDRVIPVANRLSAAPGLWDVVAMTQDWHPPNHESFAIHHEGRKPGDVIDLHGLPQVLWPVHCVQGSRGAEFSADLDTSRVMHVARKGTHPKVDSYSGFFDNGRRYATDLEAFLHEKGVEEVYLSGLATDYCVMWTAIDAMYLGFETFVVLDGCRGVRLREQDLDFAIDEMRGKGVRFVQSADLL